MRTAARPKGWVCRALLTVSVAATALSGALITSPRAAAQAEAGAAADATTTIVPAAPVSSPQLAPDIGPPASTVSHTPVEDVAARSAHVKVTDSASGRTATFSGDAINFQDTSGRWQPIDNSLSVDPSGVAHNGANRYTLDVPADASGTFAMHLADNATLAWTVVGAPAAARAVDASSASYALSPDESLRIVAAGDAMRDDVVLTDINASPTITYHVTVSPGLSLAEQPDGSVAVSDPGTPGLAIDAPFAFDAAGHRAPHGGVTTSLTATGSSTYDYTLRLDTTWLTQAKRVFPITIDPPVTFPPSGALLCQIDSVDPTPTYPPCQAPTSSYLAGIDSDGIIFRDLVQYPSITSVIPSNATISAASLTASGYTDGFSGKVPWTFDLAQVANTSPWGMNTTWTSRGSAGNWTTPGGDYRTIATSPPIPTFDTWAPLTFTSNSLTALVQGWVNGSLNPLAGVLFKSHAEDYISGTALIQQPQLNVTWVRQPGPPQNLAAYSTSSSTIGVTWNPPSDTGSSPLDHYTVVTFLADGSGNKGAADLTIPVNAGCAPCTGAQITVSPVNAWYNMRVFATNQDNAYQEADTFVEAVAPPIPPGPPQNVQAYATGPQTATVTWAAPSSYGSAYDYYTNSHMFSYKVTSTDVTTNQPGPTSTTPGDATSTNIGGLVAADQYTFDVRAYTYTSELAGYFSDASPTYTVTAGAPSPPVGIGATAMRAAAAVWWTPSAFGSPLSYAVTAFIGGSAVGTTTFGGNTTTGVVGGLAPGTSYSFSVTAANGYGQGVASPHSPLVTPAAFTAATNNLTAAYEAQPASSGCTGFVQCVFQSVDGVYEELVIPAPMDVPIASQQNTTTPPAPYPPPPAISTGVFPGNGAVVGLNARPLQIVATFPARAADNTDFLGVGVIAGCTISNNQGQQCTGIAPNGGVYKMLYWDGCTVALGACFGSGYTSVLQLEPVSVGETHALQVQRQNRGNGYTFYLYVDGQNVPIDLNQYIMEWGYSAEALESATDDAFAHQNLNQAEPAFGNSHFHLHGQPSASPPGLTNMQPSLDWWPNTPFPAGCNLTQDTNHIVSGTGSC